jgi:alpha-tubulin suppressor-like RCC1 family protein
MIATFGDNAHCQLGQRAGRPQKPSHVPLPCRVSMAALGGAHSVVVSTDGQVWSWGDADKLGLPRGRSLGCVTTVAAPSRITALRASRITLADVGATFTLAASSDGSLFSWGSSAGPTPQPTVPRLLLRFDAAVEMLACGGLHSLILLRGGAVYSLGDGSRGGLGLGESVRSVDTPSHIGSLSSCTAVCAGGGHSLALTADGEAFSWGDNRWGQLGLGDRRERAVPTVIGHAPGTTGGQLFSGCARFASCGDYHTVMVAAQLQPAGGDGQSADAAAATAAEAPPVVPSVLTFGRGNNGQLGHGDWEDQLLPRVVGALAEMRVDAVAAGGGLRSSHTLVASDSGRLFGFGSCAAGQLGIPLEPSSTLLCWRQQSPDAVRLAASPPSGGSGAAGVGGAGAAATLDAVALPVELGWWELPAGAQVTRPDSVGAAVAASVRSAALFGQVEPCRWRWRRQRRRRPDSSGEGGGCGGLPVQAAVRRGTPAGAAA